MPRQVLWERSPARHGQHAKSSCTCRHWDGLITIPWSDRRTDRPEPEHPACPLESLDSSPQGRALSLAPSQKASQVISPSQAGVAVVLRMRAVEG